MKKYYDENSRLELAALNEKCDLIVELLNSVLGDPDFLIDRLRRSAEAQSRDIIRKPKMEIVRCHDFK